MNESQVVVYSASWCAFCHAAKAYLDKLNVKYVDRDVESDAKFATEATEKSGQRGIPVLDIDDTIIVGFDRPKIDEALKSAKLI